MAAHQNPLAKHIIEIPAVATPFYDDIAKQQTVLADEKIVLNGTFYETPAQTFISRGYSRNVLFYSYGPDLSAAILTVRGTQNGMEVTDTTPGPVGGNSSETTKLFDTITSITTDTNVAGISVTGGYRVLTRPINTNYTNPNFNLVCYGLTVCNPDAAEFSVYATQIFTRNVDMNLQLGSAPYYGIQTLISGDATELYTYNFDEAGEPAIAYPFWDSFLVGFDLQEGHVARVFAPLIGR